MFGLGMGELMVILLIILLLFGAKSLPEMAKALGKSVREFRKAATEIRDSIDVGLKQEETVTAKTDLIEGKFQKT